MAKKTDKPSKGKSAADKPARPEKPKRETAKAKPPKPDKKKGKAKEPLTREERKKAGWLRKTERKAAERTVAEVGAKASAGLTYDQMETSGLMAKPSQPQSPPAGLTFEQTLLEVVAEQARQFESAEPVETPATLDPEVHFGKCEESLWSTATCKVVEAEIRQLLERTRAIFDGFVSFGSVLAARLAAEETFEKEPENSPLQLQLAEVILADDPAEAIEELLEEVFDRIQELQIVASALAPESELEKSARLELIDEDTADRLKKAAVKEAIRLDLSQRLAGLLTASTTPAEVDETFAALIAEAAQAAEAERSKRAAFRRTLSQNLRGRKEREGQRFPKSLGKTDDEEFLVFLASHRGEASVEQELLTREIAAATEAANRLWTGLKTRLAAGAGKPETAVAQNAAAMKNLLGNLAQIRELHVQLEELG